MKRFAARLLAYGAAAIPCAVFLATFGHGGVPADAAARRGADVDTMVASSQATPAAFTGGLRASAR